MTRQQVRIKEVDNYDLALLSLHLDMTKVIKMLYGRNMAEEYFTKHLTKAELPSNIKSAQA